MIIKENEKKEKCDNDLTEQEIDNKVHSQKDHYHGIHHITKDGKHDHIEKNEFKVHLEWRLNRSQLIFKMVLTAMFLAICFAVSALDILFEAIQLPVTDQLWIDFRFLDIALICVSIAILGPIFASTTSILAPWIHGIVHGFVHGTLTPLVEMFSNTLIVWVVWILFYFIFQNSPIHKDNDKKAKIIKRFVPLPLLVIASAFITTVLFVLVLYLINISVHSHTLEHANTITLFHEEHKEGHLDFDNLNIAIFFAIFGWNLLKYTFAFLLFSIIEWKMRPINHRYIKK